MFIAGRAIGALSDAGRRGKHANERLHRMVGFHPIDGAGHCSAGAAGARSELLIAFL
jgi:hypothetical protein